VFDLYESCVQRASQHRGRIISPQLEPGAEPRLVIVRGFVGELDTEMTTAGEANQEHRLVDARYSISRADPAPTIASRQRLRSSRRAGRAKMWALLPRATMASVTPLPNKGSEEQRQCASRTSRDQGCDILSSPVVRPANDAAVALGGPRRRRNVAADEEGRRPPGGGLVGTVGW
jgi:hypothetical protein